MRPKQIPAIPKAMASDFILPWGSAPHPGSLLALRPAQDDPERPSVLREAEKPIISNGSRATREDVEILPHDRRQPDENRARDDRVADRHFVEVRQIPEQDEIVEIEIVAGVDAEAERVRERRHPGELCERSTSF